MSRNIKWTKINADGSNVPKSSFVFLKSAQYYSHATTDENGNFKPDWFMPFPATHFCLPTDIVWTEINQFNDNIPMQPRNLFVTNNTNFALATYLGPDYESYFPGCWNIEKVEHFIPTHFFVLK